MRKYIPNERSDGIFGLGKVDKLCHLAHMGKLKEEIEIFHTAKVDCAVGGT